MTMMTPARLGKGVATEELIRHLPRAGAEPVRVVQRRNLVGPSRPIDRPRLASGYGKRVTGNRKPKAATVEGDSVPALPSSSSRAQLRR